MRPARRVRFVGADDRVGDGLAVVVDGHHRPEPDPRAGRRRLDDDRRPQPGLDRLDPPLEERLLLAGGVVLGVLLEVAVLLGGPDPGDDLRALDPGQLVELGPQPRLALGASAPRPRPTGGRRREPLRRGGRRRRAASPRRGARGAAGAGASGAGGSPRAPSASPSGTRDDACRGQRRRRPARRAASRSARSPCARRSGAAGSPTAGRPSGRAGRPGRPRGRRPRRPRAARPRTPRSPSVGAHQTRTPSSERSVLSQCPPAFGRRSPSSVLAIAATRRADRRVRRRRCTGRSATAARTSRAGRPGPSTSAARRRGGASRPARSTCRRGSARSARSPAGPAARRRRRPVPGPGRAVPRPPGRRP